MKKHKSFRVLCVLLSLLLVGQLAVTALAATTNWTDNGEEYIGEVKGTGNITVVGAWETTPSFTHTYGTATGFNNRTIYVRYTTDFGMDSYKGALQPAWEEEQLSDTYEGYVGLHPMEAPFWIPAESPSGTYKVAAEIQCYEATFEVYRIEFDIPNIIASGVFNAPYLPSGNVYAYRLVSSS